MVSVDPRFSEWRDKAEADFLTAVREFGVTDHPNGAHREVV
jgi:hypothetical protein